MIGELPPPTRGARFRLTWGQYAPIMRVMSNLHVKVIRAAGGPSYLAGVLRLPPERVKSWSKRHEIPAEYWHLVIPLVHDELPDLTAEDLARAKGVPCCDPTEAA